MAITLHIRNFRALQRVEWPLSQVSVLTGANGAGKTTLLLALQLLQMALERGLPEAVSVVLGGSHNLRSHSASEDEPIELGLSSNGLTFFIQLVPRGASVDYLCDESLVSNGETILKRDSLGNCFYRGNRQQLSMAATERLGLRWMLEVHPEDTQAAKIATLISGIHVFFDPDLKGIREHGSRASDDRYLHSRGRNVFTILRKWRDVREDRARFAFVDEGMRAAFPGVYHELDFDAGQTISGRIFRPGDEMPTPIAHEANGVLAMLVLLANVASAKPGSLIAIDEPETSLHPFAIRSFIRDTRAFARTQKATVLLTTHSPVVLDQFNGEPQQVFALERGHPVLPVRLDELREREWLAHYTLGELYTSGDFSANDSV